MSSLYKRTRGWVGDSETKLFRLRLGLGIKNCWGDLINVRVSSNLGRSCIRGTTVQDVDGGNITGEDDKSLIGYPRIPRLIVH